MDRNELKVQALLEKLGQQKAQLENEIADLRVELTIVSQENQQLKAEKESDEAKEVQPEAPADSKD